MKKVEIVISQNDLKELDKNGIKYEIKNLDYDLENYLKTDSRIEELNKDDFYEVLKTAKEAIEKGTDYGIVVEIHSGKSLVDDERYYYLVDLDIDLVENNNCDFTVKEMIKETT
tara:strand:+ start:3809 stop:4150 length:342 start_codon:yes stop_codon:yes gene_type:complete